MCEASSKLHWLAFQLTKVGDVNYGSKLTTQPAGLVRLQYDGPLVLVQDCLPSITGHAGESTQTTKE